MNPPNGCEIVKVRVAGSPLRHSAIHVEERMQRDGSQAWAVTDAFGFVLTKDGEWEHEPLPSSRDDAFLGRTRWPSLEAGIRAAQSWLERGRSPDTGTPTPEGA